MVWKYGMFGRGKELHGRGELIDADKKKSGWTAYEEKLNVKMLAE